MNKNMSANENLGAASSESAVVIFDLCPLFRGALADLVSAMSAMRVVLQTSSAEEAADYIAKHHPDFVILDLDAGSKALDMLHSLKESGSSRDCRCVMTISDGHQSELMAAIRMQAEGFLSKRHEPGEFRRMLAKVQSGEVVISDVLTNALAVTLRSVPFSANGQDVEALSPREIEVLRCIASGMSNHQISEKLAISDGTVKVHVKHVLKKLKFSTRVEAALWASQNGHGGPVR